MQDVFIVACVLSVILGAAFLVAWLLYRNSHEKYSFKEFVGELIMEIFGRIVFGFIRFVISFISRLF
jgi:hypothetical protein